MGFTNEEGDDDEIDRISSNSDESNDDGDDDYNGEEVDDGSLKSQSSDEDRKSQNVDALVRFKSWDSLDPHRPAEDVAFVVARFFQRGGIMRNVVRWSIQNLL
ncbi:uncharacterized protein A4U43_C01F4290 [Asparagus officinalis]|uniref:Uncharacterized protein n=1 Tax=Asparagus officinalis TaxID=4686 RepID=A0A5P1FMC4_ASPOF|nr:uncharacterized protein A4U43_C01F4290 [Asparagus officinalis]